MSGTIIVMKINVCNASFLLLIILVGTFYLSGGVVQAAVFTAYENNPVLSYSDVPGSFDERRAYTPRVIKVGSEYKMYFTGLNSGNSTQIGLAISPDGVTWQKYAQNPVYACGENTLTQCQDGVNWSSHGVNVAGVIFENGVYKMWYFGDPQNGVSLNGLGYATSLDGINWTPYINNPIFPNYNSNPLDLLLGENGFYPIAVVKHGPVYKLYFQAGSPYKSYVAESFDGLAWEIVNGRQPVFDGLVSAVTYYNNSFVMLDFAGRLHTSADGYSFMRVSDEQMPGYEFNDDVGNALLIEDGLVKIWKQRSIVFGINQVIDYVTAPVSVLDLDKVISSRELLLNLIQLIEDSSLSSKLKKDYSKDAEKSLKSLDKDKSDQAIRSLEKLREEIEKDYTKGRISESDKELLTEAITKVIQSF